MTTRAQECIRSMMRFHSPHDTPVIQAIHDSPTTEHITMSSGIAFLNIRSDHECGSMLVCIGTCQVLTKVGG